MEPFCGGSSVLLAKAPSTMETVNDLDGRLMTFWRVLRNRPAELERLCALKPHSRAEYQHCADSGADDLTDELATARRVWVGSVKAGAALNGARGGATTSCRAAPRSACPATSMPTGTAWRP